MRIVWLVGDGDWNLYNSGGANVEFLLANYLKQQPEIEKIDLIDLPFPYPHTRQYPPLIRKIDGVTLHLPRYKISYKRMFQQISKKLSFKAKIQLAFLKLILWFKFHGVIDINKLEGKTIGPVTASPLYISITEAYLSQFQRQTADYIKKLKPDVIHGMTEILGPIGAILKEENQIPNVFYALEDWDRQLKSLNPGSIQYSVINNCYDLSKWVGEHPELIDKILPVSSHIRDFLIHTGYSESKVRDIFPSPINLELFKQVDQKKARQFLNLPLDKQIILTLGRFMERKRYQDLAEILPDLPENVIIYIKLCTSSSDFLGYEEQEIFERKLKEKKVSDRVIIDKRILKYEEMKNVYSACDVAVYPFVGEAFGMCAAETLAYEKPVILYNSGNFPTFIDGNGFLVEPSNFEDLKEKILYLLENPEIAKEMGIKGRKLVEKYDIKILGKQLLDVYNGLI